MNPEKSKPIVAYYRVSTQKQGRSGLGLHGQRTLVAAYRAANGCTELGAYTEVETGTKMQLGNRPELSKALAHAKRAKAVLVIAILDRLGRNVAFISALMESGVQFVCADSPNDDKFLSCTSRLRWPRRKAGRSANARGAHWRKPRSAA